MNKSRFLVCFAAGLTLATLAGCGGGGGGGGDGGSSPSESAVVYDGNTNPADITATNAAGITANVMGSGSAPGSVASASIVGNLVQNSGNGLAHLSRSLNRGVRNTFSQAQRVSRGGGLISAAIPVNQCDPCDSGSVCLAGTLNDNGTGTLSVSYNDCRFGDETLSGQGTLQIDAFDIFNFVPTDSTLSFTRLKLRAPGVSSDASGSSRLQVNLATNTDTITSNIVTEDHVTNRKRKTEPLVLEDVYDNYFSPNSFTETMTGKVFHSVHGFVEVSTSKALSFDSLNQLFPGSGQMRFIGLAGRSIRATAISQTLLKLELDLAGTGFVVGKFAVLKWTDLTGPVGADLGDSDGDGMHNSWETATPSMNPNLNDAALDNDGDGASNIREYYGGADPNNASSVPGSGVIVESAPFFAPFTSFALEAMATSATSVAVADFNGDGKLDVAVASFDSIGEGNVSILLGNGTGTLNAATNYPAGNHAVSVAVGDFNGDGSLDLAVANFGGPGVSILLGTGSGSFGAATSVAVTAQLNPMRVVVGDFNGDSKLDLAVVIGSPSNAIPGYVSVLLGNGNGTFGAPTEFGVGAAPRSVAIGDFNGDGKLDLVVANNLSSSVSVLLGDGTGSFGVATDFVVQNSPIAVAVGDFNGDGKLDLAVASNTSVSILLGNGFGSFGTAIPVVIDPVAGADITSMTAVDFNGDGKLDLAVGSATGSGSIVVLIGDGAGSFGTTSYFVALGNNVITYVAVGDVNGDGKADLLVANQNVVSIALNTSP